MPSEAEGLIREISERDRQSYETLLNTCFPVAKNKSFFHDFPIWDPNLYKECCRLGYFQDDQVMGSACVRFAQIQGVSEGRESVALVGAVATHPSIRGQGVASDLIEALVKKIDEKNIRFTLLWGSEHDLYRRFGFELAGQQVRLPLKDFLAANLPQPIDQTEVIRGGYRGEIFKLRLKKTTGLVFSNSDESWYERHENVKWLSLVRKGVVVAYVAYNRGIDLQHMVHEWDGAIEDLLKLFSEASKQDPLAEWLTSPRLLGEWGIDLSKNSIYPKEFLCMARPGVGFDVKKFSNLWIWGLDAC